MVWKVSCFVCNKKKTLENCRKLCRQKCRDKKQFFLENIPRFSMGLFFRTYNVYVNLCVCVARARGEGGEILRDVRRGWWDIVSCSLCRMRSLYMECDLPM
jgi:hypothetical protein